MHSTNVRNSWKCLSDRQNLAEGRISDCMFTSCASGQMATLFWLYKEYVGFASWVITTFKHIQGLGFMSASLWRGLALCLNVTDIHLFTHSFYSTILLLPKILIATLSFIPCYCECRRQHGVFCVLSSILSSLFVPLHRTECIKTHQVLYCYSNNHFFKKKILKTC